MRLFRGVTSLAAGAILASCGGGGGGYGTTPTSPPPTAGGSSSNPSATNVVSITDGNSFSPSTVNVPAGTTVTWKWAGCSPDGYGGYSGCTAHNVTFDDGSKIASATQDTGTFARTFTAPGTYKYHCSIHGVGMAGEVVVK